MVPRDVPAAVVEVENSQRGQPAGVKSTHSSTIALLASHTPSVVGVCRLDACLGMGKAYRRFDKSLI